MSHNDEKPSRFDWIPAAVRRQFQSKIVRGASWAFQGQALQLAAQFVYFVVIARVLGRTGYGTFVACTAVVNAVAPFSPWGMGHVTMKYVARDRSLLPTYFGNSIIVTVGSGLLWGVALLLLRPFLLPPSVTPSLLFCVAVADLICTQMTANCSLAYMALDKPRKASFVLVFAAVLRLLAALLLLTLIASPGRWAQLYLAAALIATTYQVYRVSREAGIPRPKLSLIPASVREGFHFATSATAQTVYDNIDKTMLARLASVEAAAIYAVAYRFIDASMLPIKALLYTTYPEFFRRGVNGVTGTFAFAKSIIRRSAIYGLFITITLFVAAGLIPLVMGKAYVESSAALRWLCLLPLIKSVHSFLTDTLTGANHQAERSSVQIVVAIFNVLINLWLVRVFAWRGASVSSILTDGLLMVLLYVLIRRHLRKERTASGESPVLASATASAE